MKYLKSILFTCISSLFSFSTIAQPIKPTQLLKKVENAMKDMNSVVYKINYTIKPFSSADTLSKTALCSLYIEPKDYIGAYYIIDEKVSDSGYTHTKYDGNHSSFIYYENKVTEIIAKNYDIESVKKDDYARVYSRIHFACLDIFDKKNLLQDINHFSTGSL